MPSENAVHVAIELSSSTWLAAARLPGAATSRLHRIEGGDTTRLLALLSDLGQQASTKLGHAVDVACCFEAGRDGFWLHRLLTAHGVAAYVLEPTSILVNRRARRAKTDRLDAEGMLRVLAAWLGGDRGCAAWCACPRPSMRMRSYVAAATDVLGVVRGGRLWEQGCRTDFLAGVMAQHFLLSAAARSLSFAKIMRMSDTGVENVFLRLRWPDTDGKPTCPRCGCATCHACRRSAGQPRWRCKACCHDVSPTSGTLFAWHKLQLRTYLLAVAVFCNEVKGKSMLALARDLDVQYKTAFVLAHKLREAMAASMKGLRIGGEGRAVEIDGAYFGGHVRPGRPAAGREQVGQAPGRRGHARARWPHPAAGLHRRGRRCCQRRPADRYGNGGSCR